MPVKPDSIETKLHQLSTAVFKIIIVVESAKNDPLTSRFTLALPLDDTQLQENPSDDKAELLGKKISTLAYCQWERKEGNNF